MTETKKTTSAPEPPHKIKHHPIVIVGAGFGGIGLAIKLRQAGIKDFTILERFNDIGGTWARNTYPGAACDVPSTLYSYSFEPNPDWSKKFGTQPEIHAYIKNSAQKYNISQHIQLNTEVLSARFNEEKNTWEIKTNHGSISANIFITAAGPFAEASYPDIKGLQETKLPIIHSLHWKHDYDFNDKRVAVIGTGASAVQIIPEIQPLAKSLTVFQRTPPWILPRLDRNISRPEKFIYRRFPIAQKLSRASWYMMIESFGLVGFVNTGFGKIFETLGHYQLKRQVPDPKLRKKLTPKYTIGCKRAIFSDNYYPAIIKPNVKLVTEPIKQIKSHSLITDNGAEYPVDVIITATGFQQLARLSHNITGTHGKTIAEVYSERPQSYLGVANANFPNMFTILGPFSAAGNQSGLFMIENEVTYIVDAIKRLRKSSITRFEIKPEVQDAFVDEMHARSQKGAWLGGGCKSYYTNEKGENAGLYPNWSFTYRWRTSRWDRKNYLLKKTG